MITIIHGDHLLKSREALLEIKKRYQNGEIINLPANVDLTTVKQAVESKSLFAMKRLVIIEKLLTKRGSIKNDKIINYLAQSDSQTEIILWEAQKISPAVLAKLKKAKEKLYQPAAIIFKYLDSLAPGNGRVTIPLFHQAVKSEPIELIFYMTVRRFRLLLAIKEQAEIPEIKRLTNWQRVRLVRQVNSFNNSQQLISLLEQLFSIEYRQKTGQSGLKLNQELDIFLAIL